MNSEPQNRQVLLQHCRTKLFLGSDGQWTGDQRQARHFNYGAEAINHASDHRVRDVQVVIRFDDAGEYDVVLPVIIHLSEPGSEQPKKGTPKS